MFLFSCDKGSSEQAVVLKFGKLDNNTESGLHFKIPPINDVMKMSLEYNFIYGHWIYNQDLFYNEMKRLDEPKIDMSLYFNKVEMTFYNDGSFISYLDEQVTRGEWEIDDGHLSLKPDNQAMISYDYTINHSALYIYDRDYILAFSKRIISE